jgi:hypothetical protein
VAQALEGQAEGLDEAGGDSDEDSDPCSRSRPSPSSSSDPSAPSASSATPSLPTSSWALLVREVAQALEGQAEGLDEAGGDSDEDSDCDGATLPLVVLGPLGAVSLVCNALFAHLLLGDAFSLQLAFGSALIAAGATLVGIFGAVPEQSHTLPQPVALYQRVRR